MSGAAVLPAPTNVDTAVAAKVPPVMFSVAPVAESMPK